MIFQSLIDFFNSFEAFKLLNLNFFLASKILILQTRYEHNAILTAYVKIYVEASAREDLSIKRESLAPLAGIKSNDFPDFCKNEKERRENA